MEYIVNGIIITDDPPNPSEESEWAWALNFDPPTATSELHHAISDIGSAIRMVGWAEAPPSDELLNEAEQAIVTLRKVTAYQKALARQKTRPRLVHNSGGDGGEAANDEW